MRDQTLTSTTETVQNTSTHTPENTESKTQTLFENSTPLGGILQAAVSNAFTFTSFRYDNQAAQTKENVRNITNVLSFSAFQYDGQTVRAVEHFSPTHITGATDDTTQTPHTETLNTHTLTVDSTYHSANWGDPYSTDQTVVRLAGDAVLIHEGLPNASNTGAHPNNYAPTEGDPTSAVQATFKPISTESAVDAKPHAKEGVQQGAESNKETLHHAAENTTTHTSSSAQDATHHTTDTDLVGLVSSHPSIAQTDHTSINTDTGTVANLQYAESSGSQLYVHPQFSEGSPSHTAGTENVGDMGTMSMYTADTDTSFVGTMEMDTMSVQDYNDTGSMDVLSLESFFSSESLETVGLLGEESTNTSTEQSSTGDLSSSGVPGDSGQENSVTTTTNTTTPDTTTPETTAPETASPPPSEPVVPPATTDTLPPLVDPTQIHTF